MVDVGSELGGSTPQGVIWFGPFRLLASERLLEKDGIPVHLGSRALDILIALVECAPEVVSKKTLVAKVWPNLVVEEGSLRFHITGLRRAVGQGQAGARDVTNISGRGYCFVAPVSRALSCPEIQVAYQVHHISRLPARAARMVGRDEDVRAISRQLTEQRFVTIVGPGGTGKTTVAVAVSHALSAGFSGAVHFVDLALISDPAYIPTALASALGLSIATDAPISDLIAMLRGRRLLLVLDSCEHVIETVAAVTESIFRITQEVYILATSRESLRVEGEQIHRILPLGVPPDDPTLKAEDAIVYPAVQLFIECVRSSGHPFELNDNDAPVVGSICRRLDGIALALELAAASVSAYGIRGTAALLDNQFRLLWQGRRTALPR